MSTVNDYPIVHKAYHRYIRQKKSVPPNDTELFIFCKNENIEGIEWTKIIKYLKLLKQSKAVSPNANNESKQSSSVTPNISPAQQQTQVQQPVNVNDIKESKYDDDDDEKENDIVSNNGTRESLFNDLIQNGYPRNRAQILAQKYFDEQQQINPYEELLLLFNRYTTSELRDMCAKHYDNESLTFSKKWDYIDAVVKILSHVKVCHFFNTTNGCEKGEDKCDFTHRSYEAVLYQYADLFYNFKKDVNVKNIGIYLYDSLDGYMRIIQKDKVNPGYSKYGVYARMFCESVCKFVLEETSDNKMLYLLIQEADNYAREADDTNFPKEQMNHIRLKTKVFAHAVGYNEDAQKRFISESEQKHILVNLYQIARWLWQTPLYSEYLSN